MLQLIILPDRIPTTVDEYIAGAPDIARTKLVELHDCLKQAATDAKEVLKWRQPAFEAEYILYVYAGFKNHISLHPTADVITTLNKELKKYITSNNTLQFSLYERLP
ncbi:MAG: hypothetical protein E6R05_05595 [Candidatus Moraniibacteriota bacterium]|nr:MAG: hypothetical protein E6R05_05595 [Candidatus Moranbacteria bacterium]